MPRSPKWSLLSNFPIKVLHAFLISLVFPTYLILFDLIAQIIYVEHKLLNFLIIQFSPASFTSSLLRSKILSTLFSETPNLYFSLRIKETGVPYANRTPDRQLMSHVSLLEQVHLLEACKWQEVFARWKALLGRILLPCAAPGRHGRWGWRCKLEYCAFLFLWAERKLLEILYIRRSWHSNSVASSRNWMDPDWSSGGFQNLSIFYCVTSEMSGWASRPILDSGN
jgi:hypothetical protein